MAASTGVPFSTSAQPVTLTATVSPSTAIGTVTFTIPGAGAAVQATVAGGEASAAFTVGAGLAPGTYSITTSYQGAGFDASTGSGSLVVSPPPAPVCKPVSVSTPSATAASVTLSCTLPAGAPISYHAASGPAHGTLDTTGLAGAKVTYTPARGYAGTDDFTYTASNSGGTSAPALVSITIAQAASPPSRPPTITAARLTPSCLTPGGSLSAVFTLSQSATVLVTLIHRSKRVPRAQCASHRAAIVAGKRPAARPLTQTAHLRAGHHKLKLTGLTHRLAAGTYSLTLRANNAAGKHSRTTTLTLGVR